jgi:dihydropyrimidinase
VPRVTLTGGRIGYIDGDLRAKRGEGKYLERDPFAAVHVADATWRELNAPRPVDRDAVTP